MNSLKRKTKQFSSAYDDTYSTRITQMYFFSRWTCSKPDASIHWGAYVHSQASNPSSRSSKSRHSVQSSSKISNNVSSSILRSCAFLRFAHGRDKGRNRLTATQKRYIYELFKIVREIRILKMNEVVSVAMPSFMIKWSISNNTGRQTYKMLVPWPDGVFPIKSVQRLRLIVKENGALNTISLDRENPRTFEQYKCQ